MSHAHARHLALFALLATLAFAGIASAQAAVVVQVRTASGDPGEARVTLTPEGGAAPHSCTTRNGTCRIANVPAGRYVVTAQPIGAGQPPLPRTLPIPPADEVTVSVTLR
jgi:hypothetical protein